MSYLIGLFGCTKVTFYFIVDKGREDTECISIVLKLLAFWNLFPYFSSRIDSAFYEVCIALCITFCTFVCIAIDVTLLGLSQLVSSLDGGVPCADSGFLHVGIKKVIDSGEFGQNISVEDIGEVTVNGGAVLDFTLSPINDSLSISHSLLLGFGIKTKDISDSTLCKINRTLCISHFIVISVHGDVVDCISILVCQTLHIGFKTLGLFRVGFFSIPEVRSICIVIRLVGIGLEFADVINLRVDTTFTCDVEQGLSLACGIGEFAEFVDEFSRFLIRLGQVLVCLVEVALTLSIVSSNGSLVGIVPTIVEFLEFAVNSVNIRLQFSLVGVALASSEVVAHILVVSIEFLLSLGEGGDGSLVSL